MGKITSESQDRNHWNLDTDDSVSKNDEGKNAVALTLPSLRISYGAFLISDLRSSAARDSIIMAWMLFDRRGTETMAPTGTSDAVKYERVSLIFERVSGMTVMIYIGYL